MEIYGSQGCSWAHGAPSILFHCQPAHTFLWVGKCVRAQ